MRCLLGRTRRIAPCTATMERRVGSTDPPSKAGLASPPLRTSGRVSRRKSAYNAAGGVRVTRGAPSHGMTCASATVDRGNPAGFTTIPPARAATPAIGRGWRGRVALLAALLGYTILAQPELALGQSAPSTGEPSGAPEPSRYVLLLYTDARLTPGLVSVDNAFRSALESRLRGPLYFHTEYLDLNLFDGPMPQRELRELLRRKYGGRRFDLIFAGGSQGLRIALHNRSDLFSNAPVVFASVDRAAIADLQLDADVTGTWLRQGWAETLDLAARLEPDTRRAVVITGASALDRTWLAAARRQLAAQAGPITVSYLTDPPLEDILKEVAALPKQTVVIVGTFQRDATGRDFITAEVIKRIAASASVPVYALTQATVGTGVVGGHVVSYDAHGRAAAELAVRLLAGERPLSTDAGTNVSMLDDRQLARWGIDRRRLPPDSVVLFHEPSLWERNRGYVIGAISVVLVQSALIGTLLVQRLQRRRVRQTLAARLRFETLLSDLSTTLSACPAEEVGRQIEAGLRRIAEELTVDLVGVWALPDGLNEVRLTHAWIRAGAPPLATVVRENETPGIFSRLRQGHVVRLPPSENLPDEPPIDPQAIAQFGARSTAIIPLLAGNAAMGCLSVGTVREARRWPDELIARLRLLADVFGHALARQEAVRAAQESAEHIRNLVGRLMTAEEEERRRLGRELHDGVNQQVAALSIALSVLGKRLPADSAAGLRDEVAGLRARTVELSEAIRHLSHELHPGVLEHVGLVAALRSHCRAFDRQHGLTVTFRADDALGVVPTGVALCLYRVTQEALVNAAKHAEARHVSVTVARDGADVALSIGDDGRGFDLATARGQNGLGLISLDERVRLARGSLTIDTRPQRGTTLRIVVPLTEGPDAPRDRTAR
jgi:signal transduction histidine kinase